ncbi:DDE family transposase [Melghirimyces profundicolus]|uniref:DDE family transposase n=1 Tax=Melghirimyces profundicolus TaxID=1242148 RepID=A0A2T6BD72_9BACL|nr:IS701 family transposase [Melghirimyces profundicolus]PTX53972.1 DDE family transposase [Melghirimyces profundicolus]PTX53986.1 DDE family transposase [Melghirimyces profundicolus]
MSRTLNLPYHEEIRHYLTEQRFPLYLSKPVFEHLIHFMDAVTQKGFSGTLTDVHTLSRERRHRTTLSHFLHRGVWDEQWMQRHLNQRSLRKIQQHAKRTGLPIYAILDDSVCEKTKPSSRAMSAIQQADFHFSHGKGGPVWGHQVVVLLLRCGDRCLPFAFRRYDKSGVGKIALACELLETLPVFEHPTYLLMDSWYTSVKIVDLASTKGLQVIGGLKTNRILFPQGIRIPGSAFAGHIRKADTRLVTVGNASYRVFRYEGALNGIANAVVLLTWPEDSFGHPSTLRYYLSTDVSLDEEEILMRYANRWAIETFFQQMKGKYAFDRYRIRSVRAIERFWILLLLTFFYCAETGSGDESLGLKRIRHRREHGLLDWIYHQFQQAVPLKQVKEQLNIA